ncbi:MAG: ROK family protein, partial [Planctomycetales bacterium]
DSENGVDDLLNRCENRPGKLTGKMVAEADCDDNPLAKQVVGQARRTLAWAIGQAVNLLAPQIVVIGGGVSIIGEERFFRPLRDEVARFVFPPFVSRYQIAPSALGEEVVVHGAAAIAARLTSK